MVLSKKQLVWCFGQDRSVRVKLLVARPTFIRAVVFDVLLELKFGFDEDKSSCLRPVFIFI